MKLWRRGRLQWAAAALALVAIGASVVALTAVRKGDGASGLVVEAPSPAAASSGRTLADPPAPAFEVPAPVTLRSSPHESTWAAVRKVAAARAAPGHRARIVARIEPRTPEGTANIVLVLERARDAQGGLWLRVRLPVLPNDTTGWVPRWALGGYGIVRTHLVVDLGDRRATLFRDGRVVFKAPVGIGTARFPTPRGRFYVRNKLTRYRNPFYGPIAFGTSARSATLTDWPAGGFVGIHGTNRPGLLPGRVSHGCIRLRNAAILRLARLLPIGTPLTIRA
jgi:lipoprotein-anchoring transpeptidase ErfK/SrfK